MSEDEEDTLLEKHGRNFSEGAAPLFDIFPLTPCFIAPMNDARPVALAHTLEIIRSVENKSTICSRFFVVVDSFCLQQEFLKTIV